MTKFLCHCTINAFDHGLAEIIYSRPTIPCVAENEEKAKEIVEREIMYRYQQQGDKNITVEFDLVRKLGSK